MNAVAVLVGLLAIAGAAAGRPRRVRLLPSPSVGHPHLASARPRSAQRGGIAGAAAEVVGDRRRRAAAEAAAVRALPEVVDLLSVAVAAGLPVGGAVLAVAPRAPPAWAATFEDVRRAVEGGHRLDDAFARLVRHHADLARPLAGVLRAALDDGDGLGPALHRLAGDARDLRRRRAEEAARRLPVRLLLPLVTCSLPAFAVLTVVPVLAGALTGLRLPS